MDLRRNSEQRRRLKTGERGWLGLLAYIIVIDSIAWRNQMKGVDDETMSLSWGRWLQLPRSRAATGLAWAFLTAHLFLSLPIPGQKTLKNVVIKTRTNGHNKVVILTMPMIDSKEISS
jgi:hypothetical protein